MTDIDEVEFTDRYDLLGIKAPNLYTMCRGECEATGVVPVHADDENPELRRRWLAAEEENPNDPGDDVHFVTCPSCEGSGRTHGLVARLKQVRWALGKDWEFAKSHLFVKPYSSKTAALVALMQASAPAKAFQVGAPPQPWEGMVPYGDRIDVERPWLFNRKIALRVLLRRVR